MDEKATDRAYFLSFCIEQYKNAKHIGGEEAMRILDHYGALEYLSAHFDTLHTQSHHWLLADIDEYISLRKSQL